MAVRRVVVAMSGGVDSSVAAALLLEQGHEVIGVGLRLPEQSGATRARATCCGMAGLEDARAVAARIDIPFYVLDYREAFARKVIAPFCEAYRKGETPNPCLWCNARLKFGLLLDMALGLGADCLACDPPAAPLHLSVMTRYRGSERAADLVPDNGRVSVRFSSPYPIVAPGQAAVFYSGDVLVGGGVVRAYAQREMALEAHREGGRRL